MCGCFNLRTNVTDLARLFEAVVGLDALRNWEPRSNVAPTTQVLCIREPEAAAGRRELFSAKWGLIPSWADDAKIGSSCINARAETVATKPAFRSAFKKRRCVVVADGFYEWRKTAEIADKQPFYISLTSGRPMPFAGLWEWWESPDGPVESCTICTTSANEFMGKLHDRMPVILPENVINHWLTRDVTEPAEVTTMLRQYPSKEMQAWPVSKRVGNVRNEGEDLTEPVELGA